MFFNFFLVPRPSNFEAKLAKKQSQADQKSSKKLVGILIQFLIDLGTNLGWFWEGFGGQVEAKLGPNATKTWPKKQSKKLSLFGRPPERSLVDFGSQKPRPNVLNSHSWLLEPSWRQDGPKTPQEAPRGAQDSLQDQFWSHFVRFLVDFLLVFLVGFGVHFGSCCLLWCWFVALLVCWPVGSFIDWSVGSVARGTPS